MQQVQEMVKIAIKQNEGKLTELTELVKNNEAMMTVLGYKMELQEQQLCNTRIELDIEAVHNETAKAIESEYSLIGVVKAIKAQSQETAMLRKRMAQHERDRLSVNYNKIPKDIRYLTQTEAELKQQLVQCIETAEDFVRSQENELKRLRREHLLNEKQFDKVQQLQMQQAEKLDEILVQKGLSDEGLACLFKMHKITAAMEMQDEVDKQNVFLMGQAET